MPQARKKVIDLQYTRFYHCISRCVRRAYLCGDDKVTGNNLNHRRQWIVDKLEMLARYFSIQVCAYAIMQNHYHLVLEIDRDTALSWSEKEVIERWCSLYNGKNSLIEKYQKNNCSDSEALTAKAIVKVWRKRLYDISWFMRNINEYIARKANAEDDCKGHFWEARFKSQALLDDAAILSCMVYVDLNPIRANMAKSLQTSDFTSIQKRIDCYVKTKSFQGDAESLNSIHRQPETLMPFSIKKQKNCIHFSLIDYLELIDWTSRLIDPSKSGFVEQKTQSILQQLKVDQKQWSDLTRNFSNKFAGFAAEKSELYEYAKHNGVHWYKGVG